MAKALSVAEFLNKRHGLETKETREFLKTQGFVLYHDNGQMQRWIHTEHKDLSFQLGSRATNVSATIKQAINKAIETLIERRSAAEKVEKIGIKSTVVSAIEVLTDENYPELRYSFEVPFALEDDLKDVIRSENADLFKPYLDEYKQVMSSLANLGFKVARNEEKGSVNYSNPELGISQGDNYLKSGFRDILEFAKRVKDKAETKALSRLDEIESFTKLGGKFEVTPETKEVTIRYNDGSSHVKHAKVMGSDNIPDMAAHQVIEKAIKDITSFQERMESLRARKSDNHYSKASITAKTKIVEIFAGKEVSIEDLASSKRMKLEFVRGLIDPALQNKPLAPLASDKKMFAEKLVAAMKDLYTGPRNGKVRDQHEATITKALEIIFNDLGQRRVGSIDPNQFVRQAGGKWVQIVTSGSDITAAEQHTR